MMTAPTPGPWINDNGLVTGRSAESPGTPSFDIFDAAGWPGDADEGLANAHLISAAPDLLKHLECAVWYWTCNLPANAGQTEKDDLAAAIAAIAIAKVGNR